MKRIERRFTVRADVDRVRAFHMASHTLRRLMPLPLVFLAPPEAPRTGGRVRFRLWLGPLPVRWVARYEEVREDGFTDVQEEGPFRDWRHERRWRALPDGATEVIDRIEAEPRGVISRVLWVGFPAALAYRAWRTRRILG